MSVAIHYRVVPSDPAAHLFRVVLTLHRPDPKGQRLTMPAWIPGSYMIRDFSKHIVRIEARDEADRPVALHKVDRNTWQADPVDGVLAVELEVYAWDLSV